MSLTIRKLADMDAPREKRYNPTTGEPYLVDPETGLHSPRPFLGVSIDGDVPSATRVSTTFVNGGKAEGWVELVGERVVHRPGGPSEDPWRVTHSFIQADKLTFKTVDGDVVYRVTHNPDKYTTSENDSDPVTPEVYANGETRVDWFYDLELEG